MPNKAPARTARIILAFTTIEHRWAAEEQRLAGHPAADRIEHLAAWGAGWSHEEDEVVAALLLHLLTEAKPAPEDLAVVHHTLDAWHRELGQAAETAGIPGPWAAADLIYLVSRGAMLSSLKHPGTWTAERLTTAAGNLNRLLRPGSTAPAQPTRQTRADA